ncbi:MAG: glycosyltransferase [Cyclobacteriaceae bacterium]
MKKKKVLIFYDYFTPAFKAGGPIQSLSNLINFLSDHYDFFIYTSNKDLDDTLLEVKHDRWQSHPPTGMVYYSSKRRPSFSSVVDMIKPIRPDIIYINGLYSLANVIWPLYFVKTRVGFDGTVVIAPRGMLSLSALAIKKWKKKTYLTILKFLIRKSKLNWHATSIEEKESIMDFLADPGKIVIAQNIPNIKPKVLKEPAEKMSPLPLRLVTIAVISPMKNIYEVLEALGQLDFQVTYDIYGPIKDQGYWRECQRLISRLNGHIEVNYKRELEPDKVEETLYKYQVYVQPSQSENFGHSIFEALQAGLPVITSYRTPWVLLEESESGRNVEPNKEGIAAGLIELKKEIEQHKLFRSKEYVKKYLESKDYLKMYRELFF